MTSLRRGQPTTLALVLAVAGCAGSPRIVGSPPESAPEEASREPGMNDAARESGIRRHEEESARGAPRVEEVKADQSRVGVASTRLFHRPDCTLLEGVATSEQVRFTSPWDAVDAGYAPCTECAAFK